MKKLIIIAVGILFTVSGKSQENFKWVKVDSVEKTKSQIYSDTKLYISKTWNSAQDVIQNDDKENGNIVLKGMTTATVYSLYGYEYSYRYTISFLMKDNKVKITLDNVTCSCGYYGPKSVVLTCIEPFDGENYPNGVGGMYGLSKKKSIELMNLLRNDLQKIVDNYILYIKTPVKSDW